MSFRSWSFKGLISIIAVAVTVAALAAGSSRLTAVVAQKMLRPAADKLAPVVYSDGTQGYIVQFDTPPAAAYARSAGIMTADPAMGGQRYLDTRAPTVQAYVARLVVQHTTFLSQADDILGRGITPRFDYRYALNGMAVRLTSTEAARLKTLPGVKSVLPDRAYKPVVYSVPIPGTAANTFPSRSWIGADQVWALPTFPIGSDSDNEGEGVVVADLDTGINAKNSSFAASGADGYAIANPMGSGSYLGVC